MNSSKQLPSPRNDFHLFRDHSAGVSNAVCDPVRLQRFRAKTVAAQMLLRALHPAPTKGALPIEENPTCLLVVHMMTGVIQAPTS
jgi:hypothetical protein